MKSVIVGQNFLLFKKLRNYFQNIMSIPIILEKLEIIFIMIQLVSKEFLRTTQYHLNTMSFMFGSN